MKNIITALTTYGFEQKPGYLFAGLGSWLTRGETVKVSLHDEMATIRHSQWAWDQYGECEYDRTVVVSCHLSQLWENLPEWVLTR